MMKSFLITASIFFGICLIYILMMLPATGNYFTYILDDAYIHLAVAKNFAHHGVWGVTPYAFSSSSSSPVFTFIISILISVFGNHALIPLIFNIVVCGLLIAVLVRYYSYFLDQNKHIVIACLFTLFLPVLHVQVMSGMEHVLQTFVIAVNIYSFQRWAQDDFKMGLYAYWFYFTILLLGLIRFESMFYFVSLSLVFFLTRNFKNALWVLICGFVPIMIFGYFNYHRSGYFFPNSVVVKGTLIDFSGNVLAQITDIILKKLLFNITFYKIGLFPLLIGGVFMYKDYKGKLSFRSAISGNFLFIAFGLTLMMHCLFGEIRSIFRYEAYLLVAFSMVLIPKLLSYFRKPWSAFKMNPVTGMFIIANVLLLVYKCNYSHALILNGSANIYQQQIQSARFLNRYYNTSKVVANDIGAITYFTEIHLLDFVGLGSMELVDFKIRKKGFDDEVEKFLTDYTRAHNYQLAIAYEEWLDGHPPKNWKKVAALEVKSDNAVLGFKRLFIYSIDPETKDALVQNVKAFDWDDNVTVTMIQ